MTLKRKRTYAGEDYGMGVRGSGVYKRKYTKRRAFVPGRDRVGGYYGRYSGRLAELKFHDVDLDDAIVATNAQMTASVNLIAQGVTESERVGRKCTLRSVHWRYKITLPEQDAQATPATGDIIRIIMFVDKQCNGASAGSTDVLEANDFQSFRNLSNSGRFDILMDKEIPINYNGMASDGAGIVSQAKVMKRGMFNKKCALPVEFSGVTGAIGEIRSNNIGTLIISSDGVCGFESKIRLRFSDQG